MGAYLPDISTLIAAGIDPRTGLPLKANSAASPVLKEKIRLALRVLDEQNAVRRFNWYNVPSGMDGTLIERVLYYRGQGMFFYQPLDDKFYFLPYTLNGNIDMYGRFVTVKPIPFNGTTKNENQKSILDTVSRNPVYDDMDILTKADIAKDGCVLLRDTVQQISETNIPRQVIQEPILDAMAEAFPMARTSLLSNSGIKGMRVQDQDSQANVKAASRSITNAALTGDPFIPIIGMSEFQDLTSAGSALKSEEYLLYMQALDNFRLSLYGLDSGGLFQKKAHMLEAEEKNNQGRSLSAYEDSLLLRQQFCDRVNMIWGLGIWCEPSESVLGIDQDGDGDAVDTLDQNGEPQDQPQDIGGEENV